MIDKRWFYVMGLILISCLIWLGIAKIAIIRLEKSSQLQAVELMSFKDSVKILKTKVGNLYFQLQNVTIEKNAVKEALDRMGVSRDSLRQMGIKWRDLAVYYQAKLEAQGSGSTLSHDTVYIAGKDTVRGKKFDDWSNSNLKLFKLHSDNTKLFFNYEYDLKLNYAATKNGKNSVITLWTSDKSAIITEGSQITINHDRIPFYQKSWFGLIVGAAGMYFITK